MFGVSDSNDLCDSDLSMNQNKGLAISAFISFFLLRCGTGYESRSVRSY